MIKLLLLGVVLIGVWYATQTALRILYSKKLVHRAIPFSIEREVDSKRILIVGDSLGVGVGASMPKFSIAGLLSKDYPNISIVNKSVSGAKLADVQVQIINTEGNFDVVYIHAGANDVIGRTSYAKIREDARALFEVALKKSPNVILLQSGSVGFAPLFLQPFDWYYTNRTKKAYAEVIDEAQAAGVVRVDLYRERADDPFLKDPTIFFAGDGLHPTDAGYRLWYELLKGKLTELEWFQYHGGKSRMQQ